jgi:chromate transport protein ChrA
MMRNWPTYFAVGSIAAWVLFMGVYGDRPLQRDAVSFVKGLLTVLLLAACMVSWKATSKDLHDSTHPNYSIVDSVGWWITGIGLVALLIGFAVWVVF